MPQAMAKRLLSVDDEPAILAVIRSVATSLGFEVDVVTHGSLFKSAYVRTKPDVITLDIIMPGIDGIELIRWLGDVGCKARVILISGASGSNAKMARRLGEDVAHLEIMSLAKPFKLADLRRALTL